MVSDSDSQYRTYFRESPVGVFVTNADGDYVDVNPKACEMLGYCREELLSMSISDIVEASSTGLASFERVVDSGRDQGEQQLRTADGELIDVLLDAVSLGDDRFIAYVQDISEQKARERKLKQYAFAIENADNWIVGVDTDRCLTFANENFREFHGIEGDPRGVPLASVLEEHVFEDVNKQITRALAGNSVEFEHETAAAGQTRYVRSIAYPLRNDDDTVIGAVTSIQDLSELKFRDKQLRVLDRVLRHNLSNKMNVISGYAEVIQDEAADPSIKNATKKILDTSEQLTTMVNKERHITKVLADPPPLKPLDLRALARSTVTSIREEYPNATVRTVFPDKPVEIVGGGVGRALSELLTNAIVHSDQESPLVTVSIHPAEETVELRVADDGPGIPEMDRVVLTDESEIQPLLHGSGLGLWLARVIVQQSNGAVRFEKHEPRGSVVIMTFGKSL